MVVGGRLRCVVLCSFCVCAREKVSDACCSVVLVCAGVPVALDAQGLLHVGSRAAHRAPDAQRHSLSQCRLVSRTGRRTVSRMGRSRPA